MSPFQEKRQITFRESGMYCRYLSLNLPQYPPNRTMLSGRFGQWLKRMGIEKFPFDIQLSDLLYAKVLQPSLCVKLPELFFEQWQNWPERPAIRQVRNQSAADWYDVQICAHVINQLEDCIHPYDGSLKESFAQEYRDIVPSSPEAILHPNGREFIAAEAYIPYWQTYAIAADYFRYRHSDFLLEPDYGKARCIDYMRKAIELFVQEFGALFERLSWYKTIVTIVHWSKVHANQGEIFNFVQQYSTVSESQLKDDLHLLLGLDYQWSTNIKQYGCVVLQKARQHLSQDVYHVYEQLRLLGGDKKLLFDEFHPMGCFGGESALHHVLENEYYTFQDSFLFFTPKYCSQIILSQGYSCGSSEFESLYRVGGFDSWARAFHDLHTRTNSQPNHATFKQPRIVDALIVLTIRTEIVLREMFRPALKLDSDLTIEKLFGKLRVHVSDSKRRIIECFIQHNKSKTKLFGKPADFFASVNSIKCEEWSKVDQQFLKSILKFVIARNYFAHHAYKDPQLNHQASAISKEILMSLLETLLFFNKYGSFSGINGENVSSQ